MLGVAVGVPQKQTSRKVGRQCASVAEIIVLPLWALPVKVPMVELG